MLHLIIQANKPINKHPNQYKLINLLARYGQLLVLD
uniref:Uncharacterized protein n=1 Tax=Arundo donax TaxID=35708 RepID=A0A0A8Z5E3_ARUDO